MGCPKKNCVPIVGTTRAHSEMLFTAEDVGRNWSFPTEEWTAKPDPEGQASPARGEIAGKDCELFWSTRANQLRISECGMRIAK